MNDDKPHRSPMTAHDGRPVCRTCSKGYTPYRLVISLEGHRPGQETCQSCKQKARHENKKKARGY
jgi:hypothetical protein